MATIEINGAKIYYETFGQDRPGQAPVLLIHGSTSTGQDDWGVVAPLLARKRRVILPDCRGHGRSENPNHTYSFTELAADGAELIRKLGYARAHVIGHSNGGNVALVMLVEHPDVVQTAVVQAANAYVDDYLRDREPGIFDPERIARERPDWMEKMLRLHAPFQRADYVRDLLALTLKEILSGPNYTPDDLAKVERPALVVQGMLDPVNAPSRHGQYIARNVPYADAWFPKGVAHNVHDEVTLEWLKHIETFLDQRGDPANEALYRLGREHYADERDWVYELHAALVDEPGSVRLSGRVLESAQVAAAEQRLVESGLAKRVDASEVHLVITPQTPWALINRPVNDLRLGPGILNERASQLLLGDVVRVLEDQGEWSWVQMQRDGYLGWVQTAALFVCSQAEAEIYQQSRTHRVIAGLLPAWAEQSLAGKSAEIRGKLPFGVSVAVGEERDGWAQVCLPDGRRWWVEAAGLLPLEKLPKADTAGIETLLGWMRSFVGTPYQWGGRTPFGYDCSGLAGTFWEMLGVTLKRDADQQFRQGRPVEGELLPGDLMFYGEPDPDHNKDPEHHITHVTISLGGQRVLHSTGAYWGVVYNSLDPDSAEYRAWLREFFVGARRYTSC